jgi:hypothetical protein
MIHCLSDEKNNLIWSLEFFWKLLQWLLIKEVDNFVRWYFPYVTISKKRPLTNSIVYHKHIKTSFFFDNDDKLNELSVGALKIIVNRLANLNISIIFMSNCIYLEGILNTFAKKMLIEQKIQSHNVTLNAIMFPCCSWFLFVCIITAYFLYANHDWFTSYPCYDLTLKTTCQYWRHMYLETYIFGHVRLAMSVESICALTIILIMIKIIPNWNEKWTSSQVVSVSVS